MAMLPAVAGSPRAGHRNRDVPCCGSHPVPTPAGKARARWRTRPAAERRPLPSSELRRLDQFTLGIGVDHAERWTAIFDLDQDRIVAPVQWIEFAVVVLRDPYRQQVIAGLEPWPEPEAADHGFPGRDRAITGTESLARVAGIATAQHQSLDVLDEEPEDRRCDGVMEAHAHEQLGVFVAQQVGRIHPRIADQQVIDDLGAALAPAVFAIVVAGAGCERRSVLIIDES